MNRLQFIWIKVLIVLAMCLVAANAAIWIPKLMRLIDVYTVHVR